MLEKRDRKDEGQIWLIRQGLLEEVCLKFSYDMRDMERENRTKGKHQK